MNKSPPGIYPRNKCAKFQPNPSIFEVSRLPQSFWDIHTTDRQTDRHIDRQTDRQTFSDSSSTEVENIKQLGILVVVTGGEPRFRRN